MVDESGNDDAVGRDYDSEIRVRTDLDECLDQLSHCLVEKTDLCEPEVSREVLEDALHHVLDESWHNAECGSVIHLL